MFDGKIAAVHNNTGVRTGPDQPAVLQLTNVYFNLLRRWADV
jgi:predicted 2-oxoglutarate/Fe(II)-dependent dioxygenase YbiX